MFAIFKQIFEKKNKKLFIYLKGITVERIISICTLLMGIYARNSIFFLFDRNEIKTKLEQQQR